MRFHCMQKSDTNYSRNDEDICTSKDHFYTTSPIPNITISVAQEDKSWSC